MYDLYPGQHADGELIVDGKNILEKGVDTIELRAKVGMVFQKPTPFPMSIYDNIAFGVRQPGTGLSGGQQQRLCIARGVAVKPQVLLLDEPTSALDPISTMRIEELIHELKADFTIAIVTHNMQQAARVSDYTAYMYLGELVEFGKTDEIFIKPQDKRTEDYITGRMG